MARRFTSRIASFGTSRFAPSWLFVAVLFVGGCAEEEDANQEDACIDEATYFAETVYADVVAPVCMACHTSEGAAQQSDLVFVSEAVPGFLATNRAALAEAAALERDGVSVVLLKPSGALEHGGGVVAAADSEAYRVLARFVEGLDAPTTCAPAASSTTSEHLILMTPLQTLRRASLLLVGELPSAEAVAAVREGGDDALAAALDAMMQTPAFEARVIEWFNDALLTDRYLGGQDAIGFTDETTFPSLYWFEATEEAGQLARAVNDAIAREPLELVAHVIRNDLPMTELLTADYTMVNAFSAASYGVEGPTTDLSSPEAQRFVPARLPGIPHAGVLTTSVFLNRYPTTATNRNRHRVWKMFQLFLATDILTLADRPIDSSETTTHNPTMNDSQCTVCHAVMDPVAGAFQNWDASGRYAPPEQGWYLEMRAPGFGDQVMPSAEQPRGLQWTARRAIEDPRFRLAMVHHAYRMLLGRDPLTPGGAGDDAEATTRRAAWARQNAQFEQLGDDFAASGFRFRALLRALVLSDVFRTIGAQPEATAVDVYDAGREQLLTPEELSRAIEAATGFPWADDPTSLGRLYEDYNVLYGGIDSDGITERLDDPNGVMVAIHERMAMEVACQHLPRDVARERSERRLLPLVEVDVVPETPQGFQIPEAQAQIRANLQYLLYRFWGEEHPVDGEEVNLAMALFTETWREGAQAIAAEERSAALPRDCQHRRDFWSGDELPEAQRIEDDPDYTIRAWMAVLAYLQRDVRFLYQ